MEQINLEKLKLIEDVKNRISSNGIMDKIKEQGELLFMAISGSYGCGFANEDSDIDVRGVYVAPTIDFFKLGDKQVNRTFEFSENGLDVSLDEIGHYLNLISKSNGNRLQWMYSDYRLFDSAESKELIETVENNAISKGLLNYYLRFARDVKSGKSKLEGLKKDLYSLRIYMTGINIFERGEVETDITKLNEYFNLETVGDLVLARRNGDNGYDASRLAYIIDELDSRLLESSKKSKLPDEPNLNGLEKYLQNIRIQNLNGKIY